MSDKVDFVSKAREENRRAQAIKQLKQDVFSAEIQAVEDELDVVRIVEFNYILKSIGWKGDPVTSMDLVMGDYILFCQIPTNSLDTIKGRKARVDLSLRPVVWEKMRLCGFYFVDYSPSEEVIRVNYDDCDELADPKAVLAGIGDRMARCDVIIEEYRREVAARQVVRREQERLNFFFGWVHWLSSLPSKLK